MDSDLLDAMQMMVDYESVVYGFNGKEALRSSYLIDGQDLSKSEECSDLWLDNSLRETLEDGAKEYLKSALWLYSY